MRGAGAFVEGLARGYSLARGIKKDREEEAFKDQLKEAREGVKTERAQLIENSINPHLGDSDASTQANANIDNLATQHGTDALGVMTGAVPNLAPEEARAMPVNRPIAEYAVKGIAKPFATETEARTAAEQRAPDFATLYAQRAKDLMVEHYTTNGDIDKAKAAADWADGVKGKFYLARSADVIDALNSGDAAKLNDAYQKINAVYGNGKTDVTAAFDQANPGNIILTHTDEQGNQRQVPMTRDQVVRQFVSQYSPEKGLEFHLNEMKAKEAAKTKAAEEVGRRKWQLEFENIKQQHRKDAIDYKATVEGAKNGSKTAADLDKSVSAMSKSTRDYIAGDIDDQVKALQEKAKTAIGLNQGDEAAQYEAQAAELARTKDELVKVSGEISAYTLRHTATMPGFEFLRDMTPADHKAMAQAVIAARAGSGRDVGLKYDQKTGGVYEVYIDPRRGEIPVTAPVRINPSLPHHHAAIVNLGNKDPKTGKPIASPEQFEKIKADYVARGGKLPQESAAPAAPAAPAGQMVKEPAAQGGIVPTAAPASAPRAPAAAPTAGIAPRQAAPATRPAPAAAGMPRRSYRELATAAAAKQSEQSAAPQASRQKAADEDAKTGKAKDDPELKRIQAELDRIGDKSDPANVEKIMELGAAKARREEELGAAARPKKAEKPRLPSMQANAAAAAKRNTKDAQATPQPTPAEKQPSIIEQDRDMQLIQAQLNAIGDKRDPKNMDLIKALGIARAARIEQLRKKHGRLTDIGA